MEEEEDNQLSVVQEGGDVDAERDNQPSDNSTGEKQPTAMPVYTNGDNHAEEATIDDECLEPLHTEQDDVSGDFNNGIGDIDIEEDVSGDSISDDIAVSAAGNNDDKPAPLATLDNLSDEEITDTDNIQSNYTNDHECEALSSTRSRGDNGQDNEDMQDDNLGGINKGVSVSNSGTIEEEQAGETTDGTESYLNAQTAESTAEKVEPYQLEKQKHDVTMSDIEDTKPDMVADSTGADSQLPIAIDNDTEDYTDSNVTSDPVIHPAVSEVITSDATTENALITHTAEVATEPVQVQPSVLSNTTPVVETLAQPNEMSASTKPHAKSNDEQALPSAPENVAPSDDFPSQPRYTPNPIEWFQAVSAGSMERLNHMLQSGGIDINIQDQLGRNALHVASAAGYTAMVERLLSRMDDVNLPTEQYETALMLASRAGHTPVVRLLLARGADVDATAEDGSTALSLAASRGKAETASVLIGNGARVSYDALHAAAACGSESTVQVLLDSGAVSVDDANSDGVTALHCAAVAGHEGVVKELTSRAANANARGAGVCALHVAAEHDHPGVVKVLLDVGANVNSKRLYRQRRDVTALHLASLKNHVAVVELLAANKNCDVDASDSDGSTAMHYAARNGNADIVRTLIAAGCDVDSSASSAQADGQTALHLAVRHGYVDVVELLISAGCDVNMAEQVTLHEDLINITLDDAHVNTVTLDETTAPVYGYAAIHWAAEKANAHIVRMLLASGADVNAAAAFEGNAGVTALHLAAQDGSTSVLQELLSRDDCDRDPRKKTRERSRVTPLQQAAYNGHLEAALALLQAGSDPNAATDNGFTPLHYAAQQGHPHMISALLASGAKQTPAASNTSPLYLAVRSGRAEAIRALVDAGCAVDSPPPYDSCTTPLHAAVQCGNLVATRALLDLGADPDGNGDTSNPAPLHIAAEQGNVAIVSELLERNATVDRQYTAGPHADVTAMHVAAHAGHARIVQLLVTAGGDANALRTYTDRYDVTPLHLAAENGHVDVTETLLEAKCKLDLQDGLGYTALHLALQYHHQAVADRLLAAGCSIKKQTLSGMTPLKLAEHIRDSDMTDTLKREKRERRQSKTRSLIPDPSSQKRRSGIMALLCGVNKEQ